VKSKTIVRRDRPESLLLVEGKDDVHVFNSLLEHHKVPEQFHIKEKEGIDRLLGDFELEIDVGERRLGIVVDADTDLEVRWKRIKDILRNAGYSTMPINPGSQGTILEEEGRPVIGIWLMPNNKIPGMLEDFVSFLRPPDDVLWPIVEDAIQRVRAIDEELRFRNVYESKARIHTWLAWQREPGKPMGQAISARYLDADAPYAQELISWLRKLFDLEALSLK
jgi:hypothetical protein